MRRPSNTPTKLLAVGALFLAGIGLTACSNTASATSQHTAKASGESTATSTPKAVTEIMPTQAQLESVVLPANPTAQQVGEFYDNVQNLAVYGALSPNSTTVLVNLMTQTVQEKGGNFSEDQAATQIATEYTTPIFQRAIDATSTLMDMKTYEADLVAAQARNLKANGNGKLKASLLLVGTPEQQTDGLYLITSKLSIQHPDSNDAAVKDDGQVQTNLVGITDGKISLDKLQSVAPPAN